MDAYRDGRGRDGPHGRRAVGHVHHAARPRDSWKKARLTVRPARDPDPARALPPRHARAAHCSLTQPIEMRINEMISGVRGDLAIKIFGDDFDVLKDLATKVQTVLAGVRGSAEPAVEPRGRAAGPARFVSTRRRSRVTGCRRRTCWISSRRLGGLEVGEVRAGQRQVSTLDPPAREVHRQRRSVLDADRPHAATARGFRSRASRRSRA